MPVSSYKPSVFFGHQFICTGPLLCHKRKQSKPHRGPGRERTSWGISLPVQRKIYERAINRKSHQKNVGSGLLGEACSRIPASGSIGWGQKTSDLNMEAAGSSDKGKDLVYGRHIPLCEPPLKADVFHPRVCEVWAAH